VTGEGAWGLAHDAARAAGVRLRALTELADADEILRVMIATWGEHQLLPREVLRALGESGNVPWGAFDGPTMIGYVLGWAGVDPLDGLHVHSHMLATLPDRRHRGVGYALKLAQRAHALDQGIRVARWTYDPILSRNAWFNFGKLGVIADRFRRNFYGDMTDLLNRGERSDRFVVRWDLERPPGPWGVAVQGDPAVLRREGDPALPRPARVAEPRGVAAVVEIPREHAEIRRHDAGLASAWRDALADAVEACLAAGMNARAFDRDRCGYVFVRASEGSEEAVR